MLVFAGGWTLEAAEEVGAGESIDGTGIEDWEVLDLLTSLADKSLVIAEASGDSTRYRLLETVRQYAQERLEESGEAPTIHIRHRDYFLKLMEGIAKKLRGHEQAHWLGVLEGEYDNLRQGLAFCQAEGEGGEKGLRLGGTLWWFWFVRGYCREGRGWLSALLAHPGAQARTKARALALNGAGTLASIQGDYTAARSLIEESLTIHRALEYQPGIEDALAAMSTLDRTDIG